jgi:hypothetical protein
MEGMVGSILRAYRCYSGPYFWNANTPISWGNYLEDNAENPFALTTTLVSFFVFAKIASGKIFTSAQKRGMDAGIAFLCFCLWGFVFGIGILFPWQPWLKFNWANGSQDLRMISTFPVLISNSILIGCFGFAVLGVTYRINAAAKLGNAHIITAAKVMVKYIICQMIGLILGVISGFYLYPTRSAGDEFDLFSVLFAGGQFKEIGGVMAGFGQVMAPYANIKSGGDGGGGGSSNLGSSAAGASSASKSASSSSSSSTSSSQSSSPSY